MHDVPFFDRIAPLYDLVLPGTDRKPLEDGLARADRPMVDVIDLGGGTGRAARALGDDPVVLDASEKMLEEAREHGLECVRGDVRSLPIPDGGVDGVVAVDAVHHFPAVQTVVEEASRVLRPGGAFVIRDFDPSTLRGWVLVTGEHVFGMESTFFTPDELVAMFENAELRPTVIEDGFVYTVVGVKPGTE